MFLVVTILFVLFVTSTSSSNSDSLIPSNNSRITLEGSKMFKALLSLDLDPFPVHLPIKSTDLHQYAKEGYDRMKQTSRSNALNMFLGGIDKILGFSSMLLDFASLFGIYLDEAPKYSIDDVMNQLNSQFSDVKNQLSVIYNKMQKQDIDAYRAVEDAVTAANTDIKLGSTLDLISRGSRLFDQLVIFSRGMLGQNGFSADILQVTTDLLRCGSTSIYNQMKKYVNLVNIGGLGLGYYGKQIGSSFNVNARAKMLDDMKSQILTRINAFMNNCQTFTVDKVNNYITTILSSMQNSNPNDVAQALYNYLDDVYNKKKNFIFYVAQNFDSRNTVKFGYWGGGLQGNTADGVWTVYWAATPIGLNDAQQLKVDGGNILNTFTTSPVKSVISRDVDYVYNSINKGGAFSGRKTSLMIVVLYFYWGSYVRGPSSASIGNPTRLNAYYNRFSVQWPEWPNSASPFGFEYGTWFVDVIVQ